MSRLIHVCSMFVEIAEETNKKQGSEPLYVNFNSSINSITYTCEQAKGMYIYSFISYCLYQYFTLFPYISGVLTNPER